MARSAVFAIASILPAALGSLSNNLAITKNVVSQNFADAQYDELGCYEDSLNRTFTEVTKGIEELTETSCAAICENFPYFGLQYGSECWCGDYSSDIDSYVEPDGCNMMCTGDSDANCRGNYAMRIFTRAMTDDDAIGCYGDSSINRVFSDRLVDRSEISPEVCFEHCNNSEGALYYGTQWGEECWCGYDEDSYDRLGSATCDRPCAGDSTLFCGGTYAMTVYEIDGDSTEELTSPVSSPVPSGSPMPVSSPTRATTIPDEHSTEELPSPVPRAMPSSSPWPVSSPTPVTTIPDKHITEELPSPVPRAMPSSSPWPVSSPTPVTTIPDEHSTEELPSPVPRAMPSSSPWPVSSPTPVTTIRDEHSTEELPSPVPRAMPSSSLWPVSSPTPVTTIRDEHSTEELPSPVPTAMPSSSPWPVSSPTPVTTIRDEHSTEELPSPVPRAMPSSSPWPFSSPTPATTIPGECTGTNPIIGWASNKGLSGRMYLKDGGCGTMTDLYKSRVENDGWTPKGPIYILDDNDDIMYSPTSVTGKWLLTSELFVLRGSVFYCRGTSIGGDCDELRIQSTGSTDFHEVRGHGGSLYFEKTLVTSWDTPNKSPQEDYEDGRSFLNCVSEYESDETCEGQPKNDYGECRMDIIDSEIGYLGWFDSESYGLTWKIRGFCADESNPEVFDTTNVYGDINNSDIHHMYYGAYSYGHQGGAWTNNKMHDNHQYGFNPHEDSDYLTIANNEVYNNMKHGIIASKRCNNVKIYGNEIYNDGRSQAGGIFLHRSSDSCEVYDNVVYDMQDAGIAIIESFDADIHDNTFTNVKYGILISLGGGNNAVHGNVFDTCSKYGLYIYEGSDAPDDAPSDGRPGNNIFYDNTISNTKIGLNIKEADDTIIFGNTSAGTYLLEFDSATGTEWSSNTFEDASDNLCYKSSKSCSFAYTDTLPPPC